MSLEQFRIQDENPNEITGGNGCLCSPDQQATGCAPPYVVFPNAALDTPASPNAVVCAGCIEGAAKKLGLHVVTPVPEPAQQAVEREFDSLPEEEQKRLIHDFPAGGLTSTKYGFVDVPVTGPQPVVEDVVEPEWTGVEYPAEKPLEEPGEKEGEYNEVRIS